MSQLTQKKQLSLLWRYWLGDRERHRTLLNLLQSSKVLVWEHSLNWRNSGKVNRLNKSQNYSRINLSPFSQNSEDSMRQSIQRTPECRVLQWSRRWSIRWLLLSYRRRRWSWYRFSLGAYQCRRYHFQLYLTSGVGRDEFGRVGNGKIVGERNSVGAQHVVADMQRPTSNHSSENIRLKFTIR